MKIKTNKQIKDDLKGIALLYLAQQKYSEVEKYSDALKQYLKDVYQFGEDEIDNWLWEIIIEKKDYKDLIQNIKCQ